jgi:3'-phosphoadenosine 5'-phosphosulfate sulfotransferase (PAPS reductase)/FAD synthetase
MMARLISNSGGRTSGYMTWLELQNGLSKDDFIVFANTGKEREETLQFLHDQETNWGIKIYWIEFCIYNKWKQVTFKTASRKGEPFEQLIAKRKYLPNVVTRFCTSDLKIKVMKHFMRSMGFQTWTNLVGIRFDEPQRYSNSESSQRKERYYTDFPLYYSRITQPMVNDFWKHQNFNLQLKQHEGNCDLCFLKGKGKKTAIIRDDPSRAGWWIEQEEATGNTFHKSFSYTHLKNSVGSEIKFDEPEFACFCGE